jgi:hypothetical protein
VSSFSASASAAARWLMPTQRSAQTAEGKSTMNYRIALGDMSDDDFGDIASEVARLTVELMREGATDVHVTAAATGADTSAVVLSDAPLTDNAAQQLMDDYIAELEVGPDTGT